MQILKMDLKNGIITLKPQTLDDLWHLERVLEAKDLVRARTLRKTVIKRGQEILEGERKPVTLTMQLEKTEFHQYTGKLRLFGVITHAPEGFELGSHHTIQIEPDMVLSIKKLWKPYQIERLKKARVKEAEILVCLIDRDGCDFAGLKASGIELLGSKNFKKTLGEESREEFYREILDYLEKQENYGTIILAGPGFEAENFLNFIKENKPSFAKKIFLEHASSMGKTGIQEIVKTSANKVLKETRIAKETKFVEDLLLEISKRGLVVYGKETQKTIEYGAIETLLVSETKVRDYEKLMEKAEKVGAKIIIISSEHESGEKFFHLGGIGGFLRFKVE